MSCVVLNLQALCISLFLYAAFDVFPPSAAFAAFLKIQNCVLSKR